ncbi:GNAT family N-acetyltransferase [Rubrivivax gelatinosus]|uniref:GNAT family N-acetyltransferase n=1 Tax=Rubrivivax gelatinosus TaxID=28068 RepID=UPI0002E72BB9|nr:GNAT family N-acetyltransferase [Rubrivivax gelatinosus]MBG6082422.1 GNAT superfamily N-acetyltransferase [Rubrivivax gelatinosus]
MEIRRVTQRWELAAVHYLRVEVALSLGIPLDGEIDEKEGDRVDYLLITDGGRPLATGRLRHLDGQAKFERITVASTQQRQGHGSRLILALEDWAHELGYREAVITSKAEAEDFYLRLGYVRDGDVVHGGRFSLVRVTKALGTPAAPAA